MKIQPFIIMTQKSTGRPVEIVSRVTPENRVFIRTVPGIAGTAIWIPADDLQYPTRAYKWNVIFGVQNQFPGLRKNAVPPADMIRYLDVAGFTGEVNEDFVHSVWHLGRSKAKALDVCEGRWESFGWHVIPGCTIKLGS